MDAPRATAVKALPATLAFLKSLHDKSLKQESDESEKLAEIFGNREAWNESTDKYFEDKYIALEPEKCEFLYLLARSTNALNVVEIGTSFGVSTIYLALAVSQNLKSSPSARGKVIGRL